MKIFAVWEERIPNVGGIIGYDSRFAGSASGSDGIAGRVAVRGFTQ